MRRILASDDVARLARSAERLVRLAQAINERALETEQHMVAPTPTVATSSPDTAPSENLVHAAREALRMDGARPLFGAPPLFQARAWPLLLELFIADSAGATTSVKAACLSVGGSQTSALRCILDLERLGIVESKSDEKDGRRRLLNLSAPALSEIRRYLESEVSVSGRPIRVSLRMTRQQVEMPHCEQSSMLGAGAFDPNSAQAVIGPERISQ